MSDFTNRFCEAKGSNTLLVIANELADSLDRQRLCVLKDSSGETQLHLEPS